MSFKDTYNFENLVNESERLVIKELEMQLTGVTGICTCQECILDMAALSLNTVKPFYRASLLGTVYAHSIDEQDDFIKEIKKAVTHAIKKVKKNPAHD